MINLQGRGYAGLAGLRHEAIATAPQRKRAHIAAGEHYMPDELLLTFKDTTAAITPSRDDHRVQALLRRAAEVAGALELHVIDDAAPRYHTGSPLTLRLRVAGPRSTTRQLDHIESVLGHINSRLMGLQQDGIVISSAMPNWIICSSQGIWHPGPGTAPDRAPSGDWWFEVPPAGAAQETAPGQKVIVAVLDTSPGWQGVQRAAGRAPFKGNELLERVAANKVIRDWDEFSPPDDVPPGLRNSTVADHGLFVAGIVNNIAPRAEIHLLHILDDQGFGRTDLLLAALDYCRFLAQAGRRVVVNLSLYLMIPPRGDLEAARKRPSSRFIPHFMPSGPENTLRDQLLDAVAVRECIHLLLNDGAVVVAAAGNDALAAKHHLPERPPADYRGVIGVVAADRDGKIAAYSNRGDADAMHVSVATYGGQGKQDGECVVVPPGTEPRDGIVSLYTRSEINACVGLKPNETGWAYWSGTSFATPIISALAANVLAHSPALTPAEVANHILGMAEPKAETDPNLGCAYVRVAQHRYR